MIMLKMYGPLSNAKNMGDYTDIYMNVDVVILTDIMENFREVALKMFKLDALHFYIVPGLSYSACLKMTNVKLELLTDPNMYLFIESAIRGGISLIFLHKVEANNPYLYKLVDDEEVPDYDESKPTSYILPLDVNNLYGRSMMDPLPTHGFGWVPLNEHNELDWSKIADDAPVGFLVECDIAVPHDLHDFLGDFPPLPEKFKILTVMLSPYSKKFQLKTNSKGEEYVSYHEATKLLLTLHDKKKYILHYRNLKQCLELGLVLVKVHRVLSFKQSPWMRPFIEFNTEQRQKAQCKFDQDFFKLIINSSYGRLLLHQRKFRNVKFVTNERQLKKETAKHNFAAFQIIGENLIAVEMKQNCVHLDSPIFCGQAVLDISKKHTCMISGIM